LELPDDSLFEMIGSVFLLKKLGWKQAIGSLDFVITSKSREGNIAICVNVISGYVVSHYPINGRM